MSTGENMKRLLVSALVAWAVLSGAIRGAQAYDIVETRNVDSSFHVITVHRQNLGTGPYEVRNYIKAVQHGSNLMVCGGYTGNMTANTWNTYADALRNYDTYLVVGGRDDASAPRLSPLGFMTPNPTASSQIEDLKATCVVTEYPWDAKYAKTRFFMNANSTGKGY
jgi:hypothetical protein